MALNMSSRLDSSNGITFITSGSPYLALYSTSFTPSFVAGCSATATITPEQQSAVLGDEAVAALKITGKVNEEVGWSEEEIRFADGRL